MYRGYKKSNSRNTTDICLGTKRYDCQSRLNRDIEISPFPHSRHVHSSRPAPACSFSAPRLNLVLTHECFSLPPLSTTLHDMAASIHTVNRHPVGPELVGSRNYVPMAFAHRQESTGTGPVFLKIARVPGAPYIGSTTIRTNFCAPLFPHNDHWYCTTVNMCDTLKCLFNVSAIIRC